MWHCCYFRNFSADTESNILIRTRVVVCRLRSGFGSGCYVTWYIGHKHSITYEIAVQMEVKVVKGRLMQTAAVSVFLGCGSVFATDRHAPESSLLDFFSRFVLFPSCPISLCSPLFSPTRCRSVSHILFSQFTWWRNRRTLTSLIPHLVSQWQSGRQPTKQTDRQT